MSQKQITKKEFPQPSQEELDTLIDLESRIIMFKQGVQSYGRNIVLARQKRVQSTSENGGTVKSIQSGIERLSDMVVEEIYRIETIQDEQGIVVKLNDDNETIFEDVLTRGHGKYSFCDINLNSNSVKAAFGRLENWLDQQEKDRPISCGIAPASLAIDRLIRGAPIFIYMAQSYERLQRVLGIPQVADLPNLSDRKLRKVQARIEAYAFQLSLGTSILINNISALHPLTVREGEFISCCFDPEIKTYRTGDYGAYKFRECLREISK